MARPESKQNGFWSLRQLTDRSKNILTIPERLLNRLLTILKWCDYTEYNLEIDIVKKISRGFTLIELLIVIAVLGVLAAVVLVAIDPAQQLARGRDSGRKTSIGQLGRAMQAYYTTQQGYPTGGQWAPLAGDNILVSSGEIKTFPINPTYSGDGLLNTDGQPNCSGGIPNAFAYDADGVGPGVPFCYRTDGATPLVQTIIYARMGAKSVNSRCPLNYAWFVWSSDDGRAGVVCGLPNVGNQTFLP